MIHIRTVISVYRLDHRAAKRCRRSENAQDRRLDERIQIVRIH
jgi:hypothetical protein